MLVIWSKLIKWVIFSRLVKSSKGKEGDCFVGYPRNLRIVINTKRTSKDLRMLIITPGLRDRPRR